MIDYFRPKTALILIGFLIGSCGLQQSMYVDYEEEAEAENSTSNTGSASGGDTGAGADTGSGADTGGGGDTGAGADTGGEDDGCVLALQSFTDNIAGNIGGCAAAACHGAVPIAGTTLTEGDDAANRAVFLAYDSSADGSTMFDKISGASEAHSGGDQSGVLSANALSTWKAAEANCNK